MKHTRWMVLAGILATFPCAGAQSLVTERTISLEAAQEGPRESRSSSAARKAPGSQ